MDELFKNEFIILDGAMGTMLQRSGLPVGMLPELFTLEHPDILEGIHRAYIEAGSDVIYSNTFSSNAHKLRGSGHTVEEVISASVLTAKRASGGRVPVALDLGPIGEMLAPSGTLTFEEAYGLFTEMLIAGEKAGADLVAFETFTDLAELRIAVLAAKENTSLPILATMTFEETGRTFTGCLAESFAETITSLGVDAIGVNCSLGPEKLMPVIRRIGAVSPLPLIVKANAGLPDARDGHYSITASEFAAEMEESADIGVRFVGGCCGTDPEFIRLLRETMKNKKCASRAYDGKTRLCSITRLVTVDDVRIIGERINPTGKKRFQQALRENDLDYILAQGVQQAEAGADILDVNVGVPGLDEAALMKKCVGGLQATVDLPLQIDSNDPSAIEAGLRAFCGKAIVNSVNGETERLEKVLPLVSKYGAAVIGLTMDERGIPDTAEERFAIAEKILNACESYGISKSNVFIDCLCLTVSASQSSAAETLKAVRMVTEKLGLHTVLGVSNISFGLPNRELINSSFLTLAMENGLDLPIMNPNIPAMTDAVAAFRLLRGLDVGCERYVERFSNIMSTTPQPSSSTINDISEAVAKGLKAETKAIAQRLLESKSELEIISDFLIPALDTVGERYEKGEIFLPQLMRSADAACEAFELMKLSIVKNGGNAVSKGKIIVVTVKGDIHDIGKNIVKTILSNYGYQVIDLGRDVAPENVVEAAIREDVRLVGLSALMTTTLPSMETTVKALRSSGHDCKIMVGGAVLTAEYAAEIGADYYARDAKRAVDIAKEVLG
ncbi:MAG: homocysteine S-methyltransferase family protein [Oscillospiraceae bacterium]|nr:homocysteine S-methyltransferase family protein [Oscillospiraceae bacterium]